MNLDEERVFGLWNRRHFVAGLTTGASAALGSSVAAAARSPSGNRSSEPPSPSLSERAQNALEQRIAAAQDQHSSTPTQRSVDNSDEAKFAEDFRASFHKTLPQNDIGMVDRAAYLQLRSALIRADYNALAAVPLDPLADRGLANPLAAYTYEMLGADSWALRMPAPPQFTSANQAGEMVEVYWQAITRDVPFRAYDIDADISSASLDLARMSGFSNATPGTLFRGEAPGCDVGPYVSQFLYQTAPWGSDEVDQRYYVPLANQAFGQTEASWLAIQRGQSPGATTAFEVNQRFLANGRDLAEYVHNDALYQAYMTAALVLLSYGDEAFDQANPYLLGSNQIGFVTFGLAEVLNLVATTAQAALKAAWHQKWNVHRRLRPEAFAGRAHFQAAGNFNYGVHADLFESEAANRLLTDQGNLLLPLAYPEGSPTHPSYPAGHATVAGACATMLKAFFNESFEITAPVHANMDGSGLDAWTGTTLTVGGELNKLAANISLGRDTAGVHYRSDGIEGMNLGEQVALAILADYADTHAEAFDGFTLTSFAGQTLNVGASTRTERKETTTHERNRRRRPPREGS
ncbi:MAG: vanadium-dependent haloperoxidase [Pseudomonadota bacterium]